MRNVYKHYLLIYLLNMSKQVLKSNTYTYMYRFRWERNTVRVQHLTYALTNFNILIRHYDNVCAWRFTCNFLQPAIISLVTKSDWCQYENIDVARIKWHVWRKFAAKFTQLRITNDQNWTNLYFTHKLGYTNMFCKSTKEK